MMLLSVRRINQSSQVVLAAVALDDLDQAPSTNRALL
jgi:hypothetical protein